MTLPEISRDELRDMIERGDEFVLIDALAPMSFAHSHLPGAINLPLKQLDADAAERLDPRRAVVVYCWDSL